MAFILHKGSATASAATEEYVASGTIAANMPVVLAAGASGAAKAKVSQAAGGSDATEVIYGVAIHAATDGANVLVVPLCDDQEWIVDAAANTNVSNAAADNYLATTTLLLTVGASTLNGRKCKIIGVEGAAADRKYVVKLGNFGAEATAPAVSTVTAYTLDKSAAAFNAAAVEVFTAPYAMRIIDAIALAQADSASGTVKVMKGTDEICTALVCAVDGVPSHMVAGAVVANKARMVLAAGDKINVQAAGGTATNIRGIVTIIGHRI